MANIKQDPKDENGRRHGQFIDYFSSTELEFRKTYHHGIRHGLQERYYPNGKIWYRGHCTMGRKTGFWRYGYKLNEFYLWII